MSLPGPRYERRKWFGTTFEIYDTHTKETWELVGMSYYEALSVWVKMNQKWDRNSIPSSTVEFIRKYQ